MPSEIKIMASSTTDIDLTREFLKDRLLNDKVTFWGFPKQWQQIMELISKTVEIGESNSALLIAPRGSGKSTLISSVLISLFNDKISDTNTTIVYLNGFIETNDRLALQSITRQLQLENAIDGKVFGSFAENLVFLLACLKTGHRDTSKSVIFILDEFDLFCAHHNQTLLYNLFDVSQSAQAPICVIGLTCHLNVVQLLEKRVKSRFSHRQIFLFDGEENFVERMIAVENLLTIPKRGDCIDYNWDAVAKYDQIFRPNHYTWKRYLNKFNKKWITQWNASVETLLNKKEIKTVFESIFDLNQGLQTMKTILFQLASNLNEQNSTISVNNVKKVVSQLTNIDSTQLFLCDLSHLELSLIIAIRHHSEIYDRDPFNFEMIFTRLKKFENSSLNINMKGHCDRTNSLIAYERLQNLELIVPVNANATKVQKEYKMHNMLMTYKQISKAIELYPHLPTDIAQWASSSIGN